MELKLNYENIDQYDKVTISKVFMDTEIPFEPVDKSMKNEEQIADFYKDNPILTLPNVQYGGTGFYYDKSPKLEEDIEHIIPDYHLYDEWVNQQLSKGGKRKDFAYYLDYSIGFMTRGCIRGCEFCVNKNYKKCVLHSRLEEFLDKDRPYICLLDDNVLACKEWREVFSELMKTGKKFQFKQGVDERLLTDEKCEDLFNQTNWIGDRIFAFDNIKDRELIENRLQMIRRHTNQQIKFYTFCGYNHSNKGDYSEDFWAKDINDLFERIKILMQYGCLPYVMRYKDYELSPYRGMYINIASWCNQPSLFRKMTFTEFCKNRGMGNEKYKIYKNRFEDYLSDGNQKGSTWRYYDDFCEKHPEIASKYFDLRWDYSNRKAG